MRIIIYRDRNDNSIQKIEDCAKYLERGKTMKEIEDQVTIYNQQDSRAFVSLHEVAEQEVELIKWAATEDTSLFRENILHPCDEPLPQNTLIYVFRKHKEHETPAMSVMRVHAKNVKVAQVVDRDGMLPFAWVKAKELLPMLGMTKKNIAEMCKTAKALAWSWYED